MIIGFLVFLSFLFIEPPNGLNRVSWLTAGVAILMTIWWITEAVPIYVTGLIPLVLFPLLEIFSIKTVSASYAHPLVLLFLGGFIIASAMESTGLHKRIALKILGFSGTSPSRIIAGFMFTTAMLSMWVSNTASTVMMLPIAMSVITIFSNNNIIKKNEFAIPLLLAIAYSASIGGTATIIGTPTNIMLASILNDSYQYSISFIDWFIIGFPIALVLLPIVWFFLNKILFKVSSERSSALEKALIDFNDKIGKASKSEKVVAIVFMLTAILWIFRKVLNNLLNLNLNDTSISIFGAIMLFIIPTGKNKRACNWETASKIPWGVLFLVGGGIALSSAFKSSGLANWIGSFSSYLYHIDIYFLILISVILIIFLTELNSNTATVATFTWGSLFLIAYFAKHFQKFYLRILGVSLSCIIFFIVSNFGVWALNDFYTKNLEGLILCYTMAIPFLQSSLIGTLIFSVLIEVLLCLNNTKNFIQKINTVN